MSRPSLPRVLVDARKARDFGIGTYVRALLAGLAERGGFELAAIARGADAALFPPGVRLIPSTAPHYSVRELVSVRAVIARERPHLFHAPHYVVPLFPPRRTVVTVHDLMHLSRAEHASAAKRLYARTMLARASRSAARLLVDSDAVRAELVAFSPAAAAKVRVTPLALEPRFLTSPPVASAVPAPYILFVGNPKPHKNLGGLLAAFREASLPLALVLAGGDPPAPLPAGVRSLGFVPDADLPALMAGAEMLVLPSFAEGFGLPALEAQAVGTPVVCSDIPALREATGGVALFVDPVDPGSIAGAMRRLHGDPALRADLSGRGRAHAAVFTRARLAEETASVYDEVLAE